MNTKTKKPSGDKVSRDLRIWRDKQGVQHVEELSPQEVKELPPKPQRKQPRDTA